MRLARRSALTLLAILALAAAAPAAAGSADPLEFFTGRTRGDGKLKVALKAPVVVRVDSRGMPDGRGGIIIEQIVREGGKPPRNNRWVLHPTSPTTFSGTLTEAAGAVHGSMSGRVLKIRYARKDGTRASHVMTLQDDGRTMINRMIVKKFGIVVARVEDVIRKLD